MMGDFLDDRLRGQGLVSTSGFLCKIVDLILLCYGFPARSKEIWVFGRMELERTSLVLNCPIPKKDGTLSEICSMGGCFVVYVYSSVLLLSRSGRGCAFQGP